MPTAREIINLAAKEAGVIGVGQTQLPEDVNDCFTYLRTMLSGWQKKRYLVPGLITVGAVGNNAISNTIGVGGHWNVGNRPDKINSGYVVQNNTGQAPVSLPLFPIDSRENYNLIALKTLNSLPQYYFYDNAWAGGLGNVFIWPIPAPMYTVYLTVKANLAFPTNVDSVFNLPEEYEEAIRYNLAIRICSAFGRDPKATTVTLAKTSLNTIRASNSQISNLAMPAALQQAKPFNIYNPDGY